jgi:hypothetical protein
MGYDPAAPLAERERAIGQWERLLREGKLPAGLKPKPKKEGK